MSRSEIIFLKTLTKWLIYRLDVGGISLTLNCLPISTLNEFPQELPWRKCHLHNPIFSSLTFALSKRQCSPTLPHHTPNKRIPIGASDMNSACLNSFGGIRVYFFCIRGINQQFLSRIIVVLKQDEQFVLTILLLVLLSPLQSPLVASLFNYI